MNKRASIRGKGADIFFSPVAQASVPGAQGAVAVQPPPREISKFTAKATFYFTPQQLLDMEQLRLTLITRYGIKADKSEIMRAALAYLIDDLEAKQHDSLLVTRLR